jgi:nucleoside-diphosphate-sugar epimerase
MIAKTLLLRELVSEALAGQTVVITGSSGWFGQALLALIDERQVKTLYLQSRNEVIVKVHGKLEDSIKPGDFKATADIIIDLAFETRDKHGSRSEVHDAISGNNSLLDAVDGYLTSRRFGRYLGISSGAALEQSTKDPYGSAKAQLEQIFLEKKTEEDRIARVWSVSGALCTKPKLFAFSDFITQAMQGDSIEVKATSLTYRRYCAIEEVLAVLISGKCPPLFDSGGQLVEIGDLALAIGKALNPSASVKREVDETAAKSNYFSSEQSFEYCFTDLGLVPMTLEEQIENALRGLVLKQVGNNPGV